MSNGNNQPEEVCPFCGHDMIKAGTYFNTREERQRWQCKNCHRYPSTLIRTLPTPEQVQK